MPWWKWPRIPSTPWRKPPYRWEEVEPTLEDVFIQLMGKAEDNFA